QRPEQSRQRNVDRNQNAGQERHVAGEQAESRVYVTAERRRELINDCEVFHALLEFGQGSAVGGNRVRRYWWSGVADQVAAIIVDDRGGVAARAGCRPRPLEGRVPQT